MQEEPNALEDQRFRLTLGGSGVVVATTDRELRYTWIYNPHPDFDPEQAIGRRDDELSDNEGARQLAELKRRVFQTGASVREQIDFPLSDGLHSYEVIGRPIIEPDGSVGGVSTVAAEVSDLKRVMRLQEDFLAMVAHDLRGPLTVIRACAHHLARETDTSYADEIVRESARLEQMIADLLDGAALEAGRLKLRRERFDLVAAVRAVVERSFWSDRHRARVEPQAPAIEGEWDLRRVEQVIDNLLSNAAKYSPEGSEIVVLVGQAGTEARVAVRDAGLGLRPEDLSRLFSRFGRMEAALATGRSGVGLGLFIAKGLVEAHGGRIWAESAGEGTGSTFWFALPLA